MLLKKKNLKLLVGLILILASLTIGLLFSKPVQAFAATVSEMTEMTDKDGKTGFTIQGYAEQVNTHTKLNADGTNSENLLGKNVKWTHYRYVDADEYGCILYGDDPIVEIVPRDYFKTVGIHYFLGREYGFYIECTYNSKGYYESEVAIIDVINEISTLPHHRNASAFTVKIIFQSKYVYVPKGCNYLNFRNVYGETHLLTIVYSSSNSDGCIAPLPMDNKNLSYNSQCFSYQKDADLKLQDVSFMGKLSNVYALNYKDQYYQAIDDKGGYFTDIYYKYPGTVTVSNKTPSSVIWDITDFLIGAALPEPFDIFYSVGSMIISSAVDASSDKVAIDLSDEDYNNHTHYGTSSTQSDHLIDQKGKLLKYYHAKVNAKNGGPTVRFGTNQYARAEFAYNTKEDPEQGGMRYTTDLRIGMGLKVVKGDTVKTGMAAKQTYRVFNGPGKEAEKDLAYCRNSDGTAYEVVNIGTVTATNIIIPATHNGLPVTSIGEKAFYNCSNLTSVTIPASVINIGNYAFRGCTNLEFINLPNGLQTIGSYAFYDCNKLSSLAMSRSLSSVGSFAFRGCTNLSISWEYSSANDLTAENFCEYLTSVTFQSGITSIRASSFWKCSKLENITIPSSVTNIGKSAFSGCKSLTEIEIPAKVTTIESSTFYKCDNLTRVYIPSSDLEPSLLNYIGDFAFHGCAQLTEVSTLLDASSLKTIGIDAFSYCTSLGSSKDFYGYTNLSISASVETIGACAFESCTGLGALSFGTRSKLKEIGRGALGGCTNLQGTRSGSSIIALSLPNSVTTIGYGAFYNCTSLIGVSLPSKLQGIEYQTFLDCSGLKSITIPSSVEYIRFEAFEGCSGITSINFESGSKLSTIENSAFSGCTELIGSQALIGFGFIHIPNGVTTIGNKIFYNCNSLIGIIFPNSLESIESETFYNCSSLSYIVFSDSLFSIGNKAFYNCSSLTSIAIPNTVYSIGDSVFEGCSGLTSVILPSSVTTIGKDAFNLCSNLTIYTEPAAKPSDWDSAWNSSNRPVIWSCKLSTDKAYVASVNKTAGSISNSSNGISAPYRKDYKFFGWYENADFTGIYYTATGIASAPYRTYYAKWTEKIHAVKFNLNGGTGYFPDMPMYDGGTISEPASYPVRTGYAFGFWALSTDLTQMYDWESPVIKDITLVAIWELATSGLKFTLINSGTAYEVSKGTANTNGKAIIPSMYNGKRDVSIADVGFASCSGMTEISIPYTVMSIGSYAFYRCGSLAKITFEEGSQLSRIGDHAFSNCISLTNITIPGSITVIGDWALANSGLTSIEIPENITSIGNRAFSSCSSLIEIIFAPNSQLSNIGFAAFTNSAIKNIIIPYGVSIKEWAFEGCNNLTIYTEALTAPDEWDYYWNISNRPVVWGCTLSNDGSYVVSLNKTAESISNPNATGGISAPYREKYIFAGWYTNAEFTGTYYSASQIASAPNGTYYAKWTQEFEFRLISDGTAYEVSAGQGNTGETIVIPSSYNGLPVTRIANKGFWGYSMKHVMIPNSITIIGESAFRECRSLQSINLPNSLQSIGECAFENCSVLSGITIPYSVSYVGGWAFSGCPTLSITWEYSDTNNLTAQNFRDNLTTVVFASGITEIRAGSFGNCFKLENISIPSSVTKIGGSAFFACRSLETIIIPKSVAVIENFAFTNCNILTVYAKAESKPVGWDSLWNFSNCPVVWGYV